MKNVVRSVVIVCLLCLIVCGVQPLWAQTISVSGRVTESDGRAVAGATVKVKGGTAGTATNAKGEFKIDVPTGTVLVVSSVGYIKKEAKVESADVTIILSEDVMLFENVVVVGYGQQERKTLTSAVSSVKAAEIENIPVASVNQLMQGRVAGVQISSNSGTPGGGVSVRVRGTTSINASNDPLYVIDGIPLVSNSLNGIDVGGQVTNPMADINPSDIESMEILKDASATAIYGARAANGVVLITTKRGAAKESNAKISFGAYWGTQSAWKNPSDYVVDAVTFQTLINEANTIAGARPTYADPSVVAANTDWASLIFQTAPISNYDLSVQGSSGRVKYFVSGNLMSQDGLNKRNTFDRKSARVNLDFSATDRLNIGTSILYSRTDRERTGNDNNINGAIGAAYFNPSNIPVFQPNGSYTKFSIFENPVAVADHQDNKMVVNRILASLYADYNILDGLIFKTTFSVDYNNVKEDEFISTLLNTGAPVNGQANSIVTVDNNWIWESVLTYRTKIADDHSINILAGNTIQNSYNERTRATGEQFPSNDFRRITSAAVQRASSEATGWGIMSFFARASYAFQGKYFADVNFRADASSRFGRDNRWGYFPSVGAGWNISEEEFFKSALGQTVSNLKLRGSWGQVGNQSIGNNLNFASLGLWQGGRNYADLPGTAPFQLENPNLKWETTTQLDIGFDLGLLENRINLVFDWYDKNTEGLLLQVELPRTTGFSTQFQNRGAMKNTGIELGLNATIIKDEGLTWTLGFNVARNDNKIVKLETPITAFTRDVIRLEEGYPMYSFWLHEQTGVDPQTGEALWRTKDGKIVPTSQYNINADRKIVGNPVPDFFGGITTNLSFAGFDVMMFWQFSVGNDQVHWNRFFQEHGGTRNTNFNKNQLNRWQKPGDVTMVPRMTAANYSANLRPSRFMEDGSYIRLKNTSIGYTLPKSLTDVVGIGTVRVYVAAQNLLTFTNYTGLDPELNSGANDSFGLVQGLELFAMPQARTLMFGVNVSF